MMLVAFFLGVVLVILALVFLVSAIRGFSVVARVIREPTIPVSELVEGPVEVAGRIAPVGEPVISLSGERCIAVKTTITGYHGTGKQRTNKGQNTATRFAAARLTDRTGSCRLDLEHCEIVGERLATGENIHPSALVAEPWAAELVPLDSDNVLIEEILVPEGALVLASGDGELPEVVPGATGYRDAAREWQICGKPHRLLILSVGGQTRLLVRSFVPAVVLVVVAAYLGGLGVVAVALAIG